MDNNSKKNVVVNTSIKTKENKKVMYDNHTSLKEKLNNHDNGLYGTTILGEDVEIPDDTRITHNNRNHLVIGSSGSGKTMSYVMPNILKSDNSFIVSDPKGSLYKRTKESLIKKGYTVDIIDFKHPLDSSLGYNPFDFISIDNKGNISELDIQKVSASMIDIKDHANDRWWGDAARKYLECILGYTIEFLPNEEHNMDTVYKLSSMILSDKFATLIRQAEAENPESFSVKRFNGIRQSKDAEKMVASIAGILDEGLSKLNARELGYIYKMKNRINFSNVGKEKTAIFLTVSDTDRTLDGLLTCFWSQCIHELLEYADSEPDERVRIPVRLYLDDFATNFRIPDFDKIISNIRSREISVSVILQSMSQLEVLYSRPEALTIIDNCDNLLFLGSNSVDTAEYISKRINKPMDSVLYLEHGKSWLIIRGSKPKLVDRYDFVKHLQPGFN